MHKELQVKTADQFHVKGFVMCFQNKIFVTVQTWTSRCLMKYYASVAASSSVTKSQGTVEKIERRVLDSNPLMEAFGKPMQQCYDVFCEHDDSRLLVIAHVPFLRQCLYTTEQQQQSLWEVHPASARQVPAVLLCICHMLLNQSSYTALKVNNRSQSISITFFLFFFNEGISC